MSPLAYYWQVISTAFSQSLDVAQAIIFVLILAAGLAAYFHPGAKMPFDLNGWQTATIILGGIIAVRLILAPYWIALDEREKLKKAEDELVAARSEGPKFEGLIDQIMWGGNAVGHDAEGKPIQNMGSLVVIVATITNIGSKASVVKKLKLSAVQNGQIYPIELQMIPGSLSFSYDGNRSITYFKEDALYSKMVTAIQPGNMIQGVLMGQLTSGDSRKLTPGTFKLVMNFTDISNKEYAASYEPQNSGRPMYLPGIRQEIK